MRPDRPAGALKPAPPSRPDGRAARRAKLKLLAAEALAAWGRAVVVIRTVRANTEPTSVGTIPETARRPG